MTEACGELSGGEDVNILLVRFSYVCSYPPRAYDRPQGKYAECDAHRRGTPSRGVTPKSPLGVGLSSKPPNGAGVDF